MHRINLSDDLYDEARGAASRRGLGSVEQYIVELISDDLLDENIDSLFTEERLAEIDQAASEARSGKLMTVQEVRAHFARKRSEWLKEQAS